MNIFQNDAVSVAQELLGWEFLIRETDGSLTGGVIIETEAYQAEDAASHSYKGKTSRNAVMFGPSGYLYVYFTYGMHWCANIVTGSVGDGQAVLIRALRPSRNIHVMRSRRMGQKDEQLVNGPAKLCQALGISGKDNGIKIGTQRLVLYPPKTSQTIVVRSTPRIGITKDTHRLWRFVVSED